ncbi:hypothetical protein GCWU000342_01207 [Shuttleworthella satelles DSM 14600]|uniref:Uncharacterized protein n=1 Tax=Shuttleworthella satelles DSM 14600 TaxID=626523 RepID=C4GBA6_9FIRM|nr:hypothetical protein GCWU000342_01207 [Shuttleworthia satelles DSM 14600]
MNNCFCPRYTRYSRSYCLYKMILAAKGDGKMLIKCKKKKDDL